MAQIAAKTGASLQNPEDGDFLIQDVAALDKARPENLSFLDNRKYKDQFLATKAGACIVHPDMADFAPAGVRLLVTSSPYKTYALAAQMFYPEERPQPGIAATAVVHPSVRMGEGCVIENFVVIEEGAEIGVGCWIQSHAVIGKGVVLGDGCRVGPQSTISHALVGRGTRFYPGVRIGQDGFGFAIDPQGYVKVPQLGRVVIGNHVEIGAGTAIDRGATGDTVVGDGTWIDNLVQIGHNVKIGRGCILVSQVGIAGSTELGDYVVLAGQVGIAGHLKIGSMAKIAAQSGIIQDVPERAEIMGYPGQPLKQFLRQSVFLAQMMKQKK